MPQTEAVERQNHAAWPIESPSAIVVHFPFLSDEDFRCICEGFRERFQALVQVPPSWESVRVSTENQQGAVTLRISKRSHGSNQEPAASRIDEPDNGSDSDPVCEVEEDDEQVLKAQPQDPQGRIVTFDYDVLLSPTYRVPVLYMKLKTAFGHPILSLDEVYDLAVSSEFRAQMRDMGVLGAISVTNHPVTGTTCFFVHPCKTADALRDVSGGRAVTRDEYMLLWTGLVGRSVGLDIPSEMVAQSLDAAP